MHVPTKIILIRLVLYLEHTIQTFNDPNKECLENTVGKGENAGNQVFSPFPTVFSILSKRESHFRNACCLQKLTIW